MIGIYKIENLINGKCYIGQSKYIEKRWINHKSDAFNSAQKDRYEYPLYRAIRKYGLENFSFEVIEECKIEELNEREIYWIGYYHSLTNGYNQTLGGQSAPYSKLSLEEVTAIKNRLLNFQNGDSHKKIAEDYNVSTDTIQAINVGRAWIDDSLSYPLHLSKYNSGNGEGYKKYYCIECGSEIARGSIRCRICESKNRVKELPVSRNELKDLIRHDTFSSIGRLFGVTDNAIRKWCDKYNLPRRASDIKALSDIEWEQI